MKMADRRHIFIRPRVTYENELAEDVEDYGEGYGIYAAVQPATGQALTEMYGEGVNYMFKCRMESYAAVNERDGVCLNVPANYNPDYKVVSIKQWPRHKEVLIGAIGHEW